MARFTHETDSDKQDLIERAIKCKPKHIDTHATSKGWTCRHPNGNLELLVSFGNLDKLLDIAHEPELEPPESIVVDLIVPVVETPAEVITPSVEVVEAPSDPVSDESDDVSVDAPKKRGRPAKVVD